MTEADKIIQIIEKWKLNKTFLAEKLGMEQPTFINTIKKRQYYNFTPAQLEKLKGILVKMREDLKGL